VNRRAGLALAVGLLALGVILSLLIGSRYVAPATVWRLLWSPDDSFDSSLVHELRVPRTLLAMIVGVGLGLAGSLMQAITRNPLADPGILGINAGASIAIVAAVVVAGQTDIWFYLWFGFVGAALASVLVYLLSSLGGTSASPVRLALAGVAVSAAISALTQTVLLANQQAFNEFRFWASGSLEGRTMDIVEAVAPFIGLGAVVALSLGPALNAIALGDDTGKALGVRVVRTRILTMVAITALCGAATAAVGPIAFLGLAVPHLARAFTGPDQRWVMAYAVVLAPALLLFADVLGRAAGSGDMEVPAGIVTALVGGPLFIVIVRRRRIAAL